MRVQGMISDRDNWSSKPGYLISGRIELCNYYESLVLPVGWVARWAWRVISWKPLLNREKYSLTDAHFLDESWRMIDEWLFMMNGRCGFLPTTELAMDESHLCTDADAGNFSEELKHRSSSFKT